MTSYPYGLAEPAPPVLDPRPPGDRDRDTVCWQCRSSLDCEIARMCLAHPTGAARLAAVVRAIRAMRDGVAEPLSLTRLARAAMLSPFHFHRVFRHVTATTPARYLAALRMAEAKRLLVRTPLTVTDICGAVGYASLGTFTSQFTRLVGLSPRAFRDAMAELGDRPAGELMAVPRNPVGAAGPMGTVEGGFGPILVGLFDSGVPQRRPASCAVVAEPGFTALGPTPDGVYHLLAVSFAPDATVTEALADHRAPVRLLGSGRRPVVVRNGRTAVNFEVTLRRPRYTDPPLVMALPLLAVGACASTSDPAQVP